MLLVRWNFGNNQHGSTMTAGATAFQSSGTTSTATGRSILPPSITQVPFSDFEKAEHTRTFVEIRDSCRGCWSGAMAVVGMEPKNKIVMKEPAVRNFRLQVNTKGSSGTWTIWNLLQEGDEKVVPLRKTPPERLTQYKVAFPGMVIRIPCAITTELPRIVFEINFWDDRTRRTSVVEYFRETNWWSATTASQSSQPEVPWRLAETSLVQMKRQNKVGFVGPITDPRDIAFLPTRSPFHMRDWNWTLWKPVRTEWVDFVGEEREECRLHDDSENQKAIYERIVRAFDYKDTSNFVGVLPNSMLTSMPYRLNPSSSTDSSRAFFAHAFNDHDLAILEVEYMGRILKSTSLHSFRKK